MEQPSEYRWSSWKNRLQPIRQVMNKFLLFGAGIVVAFSSLLLYNYFFPPAHQLTPQEVNASIAQALASATPPPAFSEQVYQIIRPSLVLIQTKDISQDGKTENGLGSGVIIDDKGEILTALHVVDGASDIQVFFADGTQSRGQVTVKKPEMDIAVLKTDQLPAQVIPAVLGNPKAMKVGDEAFAVGNPFGLYSSMTAGVISGFDRSFQTANSGQKLEGLIQIDAAVNPGNSGGPLLNRYGQVIGIVEGIANPTQQDVFIGIGFAVPIDIAGGAVGSPLD